jgi:hypothetical protein
MRRRSLRNRRGRQIVAGRREDTAIDNEDVLYTPRTNSRPDRVKEFAPDTWERGWNHSTESGRQDSEPRMILMRRRSLRDRRARRIVAGRRADAAIDNEDGLCTQRTSSRPDREKKGAH